MKINISISAVVAFLIAGLSYTNALATLAPSPVERKVDTIQIPMMQNVTTNAKANIMELILDFAVDRLPKMKSAWGQYGGWEGWLQVELADYLRDELYGPGKDYHLPRRELTGVYTDTTLRTDIWINSKDTQNPDLPNLNIELKCESWGRDLGEFTTAVLNDVGKARGGFQPFYTPVRSWVVVITLDQAMREHLMQNLADNDSPFKALQIKDDAYILYRSFYQSLVA